MLTDEQYRWLAEQSYWVDKLKKNVKYHPKKNETYPVNPEKSKLGNFRVLRVTDNQENGMQAMAVAPIVDGKADTSRIVVAYAGTNFDDPHDRDTDVQSVGLGDQKSLITGWEQIQIPYTPASIPEWIETSAQPKTALEFAQKVQKDYPYAHITTTGHSLGETLALYTAVKMGWSNVGYNGPDPHHLLTEEEIKYMQQHPTLFRNYRNPSDVIGNITGNKTKTAIDVDNVQGNGIMGRFLNTIENHYLNHWKFDKKGNLVDRHGKVILDHRVTEYIDHSQTILMNLKARLRVLKSIRVGYSKDGLSSGEQIYLDSEQALALVASIETLANESLQLMIAQYDEAIREMEKLWRETERRAATIGTDLTSFEVLSALEEAGASRDSIEVKPYQKYREQKSIAYQLKRDFESLACEIRSGIERQITTDRELAGRFGL